MKRTVLSYHKIRAAKRVSHGNGKTLLADMIAKDIEGDLYRPDCTKDAETAIMIDQARRDITQNSMFSSQWEYIEEHAIDIVE